MSPKGAIFHIARLSMVIALAIMLAACATKKTPEPQKPESESAVKKTTRPAPKAETAPEVKDSPPKTLYTAKSGVRLYADPSVTKTSRGTLPQGEKVVRYKTRSGYARIKVVRTGKWGWVENRFLLTQKPVVKKKTKAPAPKPEPAPAQEKAAEPEAEEGQIYESL